MLRHLCIRINQVARPAFCDGVTERMAQDVAATADNWLPLEAVGSGRAEQLSRVADAGLVQQGRVFLLSLDAIKSEMGARWNVRNEIIWETFERDLTRAMPAPDVFIRIDDATILAAISSTDGYSGQVRCAQVLRAALEFFLGRNQESDLSISRVSDLGPDGVAARRIDPATVERPSLPPALTTPEGAATAPEEWKPPLSSRSMAAGFIADRHGFVDLEIKVTPVWRLDRRLVAAYAIRRRLSAPMTEFTDRDREAIDGIMLDFLRPLMSEYQSKGGSFALLCPITFSTLSGRRSRLDFMQRCSDVAGVMKRAVVMEIDDIARGTPSSRIRDTVAMCRPLARLMTVTINESSAIGVLGDDYGNQGVAVDARLFNTARLGAAVAAGRRRTTNVVVHGVGRSIDLDWLRQQGASHATEELWVRGETAPPLALAS